MNQTGQQFNPAMVSRTYTDSQWQLKEDWYVQQVQSINIPASPGPADLANVACAIERVLSIARLDMSYVEQNYNRFQLLVKLQESILYTGLGSIQGMKLTVAERESYVKAHLNKDPYNGGTLTLYQLREKSDARYVFLKGVIAALIDKKDLLITHSSAIKAEATLNNYSPSAPQQQNYAGQQP